MATDTIPSVGALSDPEYQALVASGVIPAVAGAAPAVAKAAPAAIPGVMSPVQRNNLSLDMATSGMRTAHPTTPAAGGIPAVGAAPSVAAAPDTSALTGGIPTVAKPTTAQSHAAGKAEYSAQMPASPDALGYKPFTPEYVQQEQKVADFKAAHPLGSSISEKPGFLGKLEHGLATVGNIAGDALIPGVMSNIPGTQRNLAAQKAERFGEFKGATEAQQKAAETGLEQAETEAAKNPGGKEIAQQQAEMKFRASVAPAIGLQEGTPEYARYVATGSMQEGGKTPAEETYNSLLKATNPATGKPYTPQEALAEVTKAPASNETQEDQRYEKIAADAKLGKAVSPEDKAWSDSYEKRKALGPQAAASAGAQNATLTPLINPTTGEIVGSFNTKTGEFKPAAKGIGTATTAAGAGVGNKQTEAFNKDYVNPAESIERSYQMFQDAYRAIQSGDAKTGAEDMLLLSQHLGTTFGQVKGSRMNKDLIQEHKDAIGIQDRIERYANNLASGQMLSPDQRKEFGDLIANMRNLTWQIATKEASRNNQPINFLPPDVQINMRDSKGVTRPVPGDHVQEYLDKGAHLGG
jgi:hypothetical protein